MGKSPKKPFNHHGFKGDHPSVGEELLMNVPELELKCHAVYDAIRGGYFKRAEALEIYEVSAEDYKTYLKAKREEAKKDKKPKGPKA